MDTYSRRVFSRGGGFRGRCGISAGFSAGDGTDDCCLRYHGIELSCVRDSGVADGEASVATSGVASFEPSIGSAVASCNAASAATGLEVSLRKANSGSSAEGSFLSTRRQALLLKAHRENVEGEVRNGAPLSLGAEVDFRTCELRQALQINLDEAILGKDILRDTASTDGGMVWCS
jgi:hypothetical protein